MVEVRRTEQAGGSDGDPIKSAVGNAIQGLLKQASKQYLGVDIVPDDLGQSATKVIDRFTATTTKALQGTNGKSRINDKTINQGAYALAKAFLIDGKGDWKTALGSLVESAIGEPEAPAKEELGRLLDKRTYVKRGEDGNKVIAPENHLLRQLMRSVGIDDSKPISNLVADAVETCQQKFADLVKNWGDAGQELADAGIQSEEHRDAVADALLKAAGGAELGEGVKRAEKTSKKRTESTGDSYAGPVPQSGLDDETSASSVQAREFAGTNPMMTYILNRSFDKKTVEALPEGITAPKALIAAAAQELGLPADSPRLDEATEALQQALQDPRFKNAESPTPFIALEGVLTALINHSKQVERGAKNADTKLTAQNARGRYEGILEKIQTLEVGMSRVGGVEKLSPSLAQRLNEFTAYALGELVANSMRLPANKRGNLQNLDILKKIADHVLKDYDHEQGTAIDRMASRRVDKALSEKLDLMDGIDLADPAGSAKSIVSQIVGDEVRPEFQPAVEKLTQTLEGIFRDKKPANNVELVQHVAEAMGEAGIPAEQLSPILWPAATVENDFKDQYYGLAKMEGNLWNLRQYRKGAQEEVEKLQREVDGFKAKLAENPDDPDLKDFLKGTQGNLETAKSRLADIESQIEQHEDSIAQGKKALERTPDTTAALAQGAISKLAALYAQPDQMKADFEETSKQFEKDWQNMGRPVPPGFSPQEPGGPDGPDDPGDTKKTDSPDGPDGPSGKGGEDDDDGLTPAQLRAIECGAILNDPSLSIQDKVFLFMLIFAAYSDQEREDKLKELTKLDERQAEWDKQRKKLGRTKDALVKEHGDIVEKMNAKQAKIDSLKASGKSDDSDEIKAAKRELEKLGQDKARVKENIDNTTEEYDKVGAESNQAPRTREVLFAEVEKITKFRDQMINMARSVIEDANRLIERIFR